MHTRYDFGPGVGEKIVYVRPVPVEELPDEIRAQVPGVATLYAICGTDGARLALCRDRRTAFLLARQKDYAPVSAH